MSPECMDVRISQDEGLVDFVAAVLVHVEDLVIVAALRPAQDVVVVVVDAVPGVGRVAVAYVGAALLQALRSQLIKGDVLTVAADQ